MYCDPQDPSRYVSDLKIIPICTNDLRCIIENKISYSQLYKHFNTAHEATEMHPQKWYDEYVSVNKTKQEYTFNESHRCMAADVVVKYNE